MGAPSDIIGLGEYRRVTVDATTLNLPSGAAQYKLVAGSNQSVDVIKRTARNGQVIMLLGPTSNTVTVRSSESGTNIVLVGGGESRALEQNDTLVLRYESDTWIEVASRIAAG